MAKFSKDKGARVERYFVNKLIDGGLNAKRVPLSGAITGFPDDITLDWPMGGTAQCEVKARADGFKEIYKWLKPATILFLKADRQDALAVIRLKDFILLMQWANVGTEYYRGPFSRTAA
jgi:Holliday junction resolvase